MRAQIYLLPVVLLCCFYPVMAQATSFLPGDDPFTGFLRPVTSSAQTGAGISSHSSGRCLAVLCCREPDDKRSLSVNLLSIAP